MPVPAKTFPERRFSGTNKAVTEWPDSSLARRVSYVAATRAANEALLLEGVAMPPGVLHEVKRDCEGFRARMQVLESLVSVN